jgi:hypothetical protein
MSCTPALRLCPSPIEGQRRQVKPSVLPRQRAVSLPPGGGRLGWGGIVEAHPPPESSPARGEELPKDVRRTVSILTLTPMPV